MDYSGSCLCGSVQFAVDAPLKFVANCHCSLCRRAHGSVFVTWAGVPDAQFELRQKGDLRSYSSSEGATREFCGDCGSPLFFRSTRWPGEVHLAVANVHEPHDLKPRADVFYSDHATWLTDDKLPRYGGTSGTERLPEDD